MADLHWACQWGTGERWGEYVILIFFHLDSISPSPIKVPSLLIYHTHVLSNSKPTETGMQRLALSDDDKKARDWFVGAVKALGCKVTIDSMGNIFAVRAGLKDGPPTYVGSHLDTQPSGGRYDGILGVTAGIEMLKVLDDNWVETE